MSANAGNADSGYQADFQPPWTKQISPEMQVRSSQFSSDSFSSRSSRESSNMATLMDSRAPPTYPSPRKIAEEVGPLDLPIRPRAQPERVELPSIRYAIPEISMPPKPKGENRVDPAMSCSPTTKLAALFTPSSEYAHSPSLPKRRRLSSEEDWERERDAIVPRLYTSPNRPAQRSHSAAISPTTSVRRPSGYSTPGSARSSPYTTPSNLPTMRSPPRFDASSISRTEWRPTLPSLPSLILNHNMPLARGRNNFSEYALDSSHSGAQTYPQVSTSAFEPPLSSYHPTFSYGYQQPRGQSYSEPSGHTTEHDRTPFSSNGRHGMYPGSNFPYGSEGSDGGHDSKQRKRRGNLPKETTDKLRAWFVAHLQHPYPTEDEKQDLMRQTGLQMNQISNWFINARRRQLPAMINNARAESDARSARSSEGGLRGEIASEYGEDGHKRRTTSLGDSDGEGSVYDDEFEGLREIRSLHSIPKRESI